MPSSPSGPREGAQGTRAKTSTCGGKMTVRSSPSGKDRKDRPPGDRAGGRIASWFRMPDSDMGAGFCPVRPTDRRTHTCRCEHPRRCTIRRHGGRARHHRAHRPGPPPRGTRSGPPVERAAFNFGLGLVLRNNTTGVCWAAGYGAIRNTHGTLRGFTRGI